MFKTFHPVFCSLIILPLNVTDLFKFKRTNFYQKLMGQVNFFATASWSLFLQITYFFNKAHIVIDFVFGMISESWQGSNYRKSNVIQALFL